LFFDLGGQISPETLVNFERKKQEYSLRYSSC